MIPYLKEKVFLGDFFWLEVGTMKADLNETVCILFSNFPGANFSRKHDRNIKSTIR